MLGQRTVERFALEPLLAIGVMYGQLPASVIRYSRVGTPVSLSEHLLQFWTPNAKYDRYEIGGIPELLVIDRRLRGSLHDEFFQWLKPLCDWKWSDELPNGKQFAAQTRCLQSDPHVFVHDSTDVLERLEVADLNKHERELWYQLDFSSAPPKQRALLNELTGSSRAVPPGLEGLGPDVNTTSQAFFCYSTQNDRELGQLFWRKGDKQSYGWIEPAKSQKCVYEDRENARLQENIATLMLMQEGASFRLATQFAMSVSALRRNILADRDLDSDFNRELRSQLGVNLVHGSCLAPTTGLLLSIDEKFPNRKAERVWDALTFGGDYASMEILPEGILSRPYPSWSYIVVLDSDTPILLRIASPVADKFIGSIPNSQESPVCINRALFHRLVNLFNYPDETDTNAGTVEYLWPILVCDIESRSAPSGHNQFY